MYYDTRMPDIVLTTLNARYWHSSFGLRYLLANMGDLKSRTAMLEFGISERPVDMIDTILAHNPKIVGVGVYIWNVEPATKLVADLKRVRPDVTIVLGGPEVSYETEGQGIVEDADFVVTGEADIAFPQLCRRLLNANAVNEPAAVATETAALLSMQEPAASSQKIIGGGVPALNDIQLPYHLYTDEDIAHRVIYVEVSRGCPFTCEFCLSALDIPVRLFDLDSFLAAMQDLLDRGARQFKFVDRTFNLNMRVSTTILQFFLDRCQPDLFLHFEMIPDRLPDSLKKLIAQFPPGALQFEIGVQTFNDDVGELISRRQNNDELASNFAFLREHTGVHIHADLIVGLPGESLESFAAGFNRLVELAPQEIQVGILKRLKGTPITRHDQAWQMVYSKHAPYEILSNRLIDFETMHRLRRFSRYWDLTANSGNFVETTPLIWSQRKPFDEFLKFSDWLFATESRTHGIPLDKLTRRLFEFLTVHQRLSQEVVGPTLLRDYSGTGRRNVPDFLREFTSKVTVATASSSLPPRQARHQS